MKRACIAIVDGNTARLYAYQQDDNDQPQLQEQKDLVNVQRRAKDEDLYSTTKPGSRYQEGGRGSTDDHRDANRAHHDEEFASQVIDEVADLVRTNGFGHVVLVSSPKMLGSLRHYEDRLTKQGITIDEVQRDLTRMTSPQIHDHLAAMNIIEPRGRLTFARR